MPIPVPIPIPISVPIPVPIHRAEAGGGQGGEEAGTRGGVGCTYADFCFFLGREMKHFINIVVMRTASARGLKPGEALVLAAARPRRLRSSRR